MSKYSYTVSITALIAWLNISTESPLGPHSQWSFPYWAFSICYDLCDYACLVIQSCLTLWDTSTEACQAPMSMGLFSKGYWNRLPFSSPEDLPDPGIEPSSPVSPASQVDLLPAELLGKLLCDLMSTKYHTQILLQEVGK